MLEFESPLIDRLESLDGALTIFHFNDKFGSFRGQHRDRAEDASLASHDIVFAPEGQIETGFRPGQVIACERILAVARYGRNYTLRIDFPDTTGTNSFVEIFRATTPPGSITDATVFHRLAEAFAEFAPRRIQFYHPSHLLMAAPGASVDQHFLAGLARAMATRSPAPGLERIELTRATNLSCYPRYKAAYRQMHDERPALLGSVRIEDEESLAACLADGLLFEIVVDGVWAGIVAARDRVFGGVRGVYMIEIVLDASHRGQSLGPAVHQRLAAIVSTAKPAAVITGTIARANTPSLKTANRAGRVEIGAWYWLEL